MPSGVKAHARSSSPDGGGSAAGAGADAGAYGGGVGEAVTAMTARRERQKHLIVEMKKYNLSRSTRYGGAARDETTNATTTTATATTTANSSSSSSSNSNKNNTCANNRKKGSLTWGELVKLKLQELQADARPSLSAGSASIGRAAS